MRWASKFGEAGTAECLPRNWKPQRPASILEKLRSSKEEPDREPRQYTVFFGTDRKPADENDAGGSFLNERGGELRRGHCLVEIPKTHKFGSVGRDWLRLLQPATQRKFRLMSTNLLTRDNLSTFAGSLLDKFDSDEKQNLLYLHGYRNSFDDAALRAAQLGYDLKIPGCTFFYSWPSTASATGYSADEATVATSEEYCYEFVLELLNSFPNTPLNIIAHSMGNRLAVALFERLARTADLPGELGQLIFAAADIDVDRFKQAIKTIEHLPKRMTSYVSKGDGAVQMSQIVHHYPRVGLVPPLTIVDPVDTILVEGFKLFEFEGHGYYADAGPVLSDMFNLIRHGGSPDERPQTCSLLDESTQRHFWSLPVG